MVIEKAVEDVMMNVSNLLFYPFHFYHSFILEVPVSMRTRASMRSNFALHYRLKNRSRL